MTEVNYEDIEVGYELPEQQFGPITRTMLALYAGAGGDHNPMHIDSDFAKEHGMPDQFAHGALVMSLLGRLLTGWADHSQLREYGIRFKAITPVLAILTCKGTVVEKLTIDGEPCIKLELSAAVDDGTAVIDGEAIIGFG